MSLLNVENIAYRVPDRIILSDVSFTAEKGDFITVIGPNGAGKSTLLKIIAGIVRPSGGRLTWARDMVKGYVPQNFFINNQLPITVRDFLTLANRDYDAAFEYTGIGGIADRPLTALSGGETRRVLLARALLKKPEVLFLDEPTAGLDVDAEAEFYRIIAAVKNELGCTVFMISHNLHMVMADSTKVVCLNRHICCQGSPDDVMLSSGYLKLFTHHDHHCHHDGGDDPCGTP